MSGAEKVRELRERLDEVLASLPPKLRQEALSHISYANEMGNSRSNERLEFLGDAVLHLCVGSILFDAYPDASEGDLTRMRAHLVSGSALSALALRGGLGRHLKLGRGEASSGGRSKPRVLAGAFEALVGALYVHKGFQECMKFVREAVFPEGELTVPVDSKTLLQELVQEEGGSVEYTVVEVSGPDHMPRYTVACLVNGREVSRGQGGSKKEAEEDAAKGFLASREAL
ncbi:MAG TPA: ribonuclease III [Firmicutes bacterium]|nr:ribonuclease III [Candidatus Fermentithermobacillaceae bacterium]